MKTITRFFLLALIIFSFASCDKNNINSSSPEFSNDHWFYDFNGTVDRGDAYDVIKSSADGKVYVCGAFLGAANNPDMKNLARWVPSTNTWEVVPGINSDHSNFIRCVVEDNEGNLYFGGDFSQIGGIVAGRVGKFNVNEGTWENLRQIDYYDEEQQRGPVSGGVYAIEIVDDYVYIGGGTFNSDSTELLYIRRFNIDTKKWEAVGGGLNGRIRSLCTDGNGNLYVGGEFTEAGDVQANYIAKWDGENWSALGNGTDDYVLSMAYANGNLYAGGSFKFVENDIRSQGIAKWNGTSWEAMSSGVYASWGNTYSVHGVAVDSDGKAYIGGFFDKKYSDDQPLNHVGVFADGEWQQMGEGLAKSSSQGIMGMHADGKDVYFVGYFGIPSEGLNDRFNIAIWNDTKSF